MIKIIDLDDEGLAEAKSFFVKFFKCSDLHYFNRPQVKIFCIAGKDFSCYNKGVIILL